MTKVNVNLRHHAAHPLSAVKPNLAVNKKPNSVRTELYNTAGKTTPNPNPSVPGAVGVDAVNSRKQSIDIGEDNTEDQDLDGPEDRLIPLHN
jgi:hypothetical protein